MKLDVNESRGARDLVRFFRRREYLAVEQEPGVIEVVPIDSVSERADRSRTLRDLEEWRLNHPGIDAAPSRD
jgi:hypothetical protein